MLKQQQKPLFILCEDGFKLKHTLLPKCRFGTLPLLKAFIESRNLFVQRGVKLLRNCFNCCTESFDCLLCHILCELVSSECIRGMGLLSGS